MIGILNLAYGLMVGDQLRLAAVVSTALMGMLFSTNSESRVTAMMA